MSRGRAGSPTGTSHGTARTFAPDSASNRGSRTSDRSAAVKPAPQRAAGASSGRHASHGPSRKAAEGTRAAPARSPAGTATGDLWSGFGKAAALVPGDGDSATASGGGPRVGLGIGLLAVGALALVGGLALAGTRRPRRARA